MQTQTIIDQLIHVQIGTIIAWVAVISGIIASISAITVKLYKAFSKYKDKSDEYEKQKEALQSHESTLQDMSKVLTSLVEINKDQLKHSIVTTCDVAIAEGKISAGAFKSLMELFSAYTDVFHGNGYIAALVEKVRQLPVVGRLE